MFASKFIFLFGFSIQMLLNALKALHMHEKQGKPRV